MTGLRLALLEQVKRQVIAMLLLTITLITGMQILFAEL